MKVFLVFISFFTAFFVFAADPPSNTPAETPTNSSAGPLSSAKAAKQAKDKRDQLKLVSQVATLKVQQLEEQLEEARKVAAQADVEARYAEKEYIQALAEAKREVDVLREKLASSAALLDDLNVQSGEPKPTTQKPSVPETKTDSVPPKPIPTIVPQPRPDPPKSNSTPDKPTPPGPLIEIPKDTGNSLYLDESRKPTQAVKDASKKESEKKDAAKKDNETEKKDTKKDNSSVTAARTENRRSVATIRVSTVRGAKISIDGNPTISEGEDRRFFTPPLDETASYNYVLEANIQGRRVVKTINVRGGQTTEVEMR